MASAYLKTTKDGRRFYEIQAADRTGARHTDRWYIPDGWGATAIERELNKVKADFERRVKAGEVMTRKQAKEAARQEAEEAAKIQTLKQYGERVWMPEKTADCAEHTRDTYQRQLEKHIYPALGSFKLPEITAAQIDAFLLMKRDSGLSHETCGKLYRILKQIFDKAFRQDVIGNNPMLKVRPPKATKKGEAGQEAKAYTAEEVAYIKKCLEQEPLKWQTLIYLLADTGVRKGEALGLKWGDIDFEAAVIHIRRTLCYTKEKGIYTNTPKNGKSRTVPVPRTTLSLLVKLEKEQRKGDKAIVLHKSLTGFVFQQDGINTPMHPDTPTRYLKRLEKRYAIKDFHPHKLRHSFASVAITQGADVASVSEILGHSDKAVTLRMYTHADEESKRRASEVFERAIAEASRQA